MTDPGEFFRNVALVGPALFFESAVPASELATRFEKLRPETAREFLLLRTLAELQKCGLASQRWADARAQAKEEGRFGDLRIESLAVEQAAWLRRLVEALATLIGFQTTNEHAFYFHFLVLAEYDRERKQIQDEREFFGRASQRARDREAAARARLDAAYDAVPNKQACWYLDSPTRPRFKSFRDRYAFVLNLATPAERCALGYTYQATFGEASGTVHFSVATELDDGRGIHTVADSFCLMLTVAVLLRAHELAGVEARGVNASLIRSRRSLDERTPLVSRRAGVGDFVLIEGPAFGEVVELDTSKFGYEMYRVHRLAPPQPDVEDDKWLTAPAIQMFLSWDEQVARLSKAITGELKAPPFTKEEIAEAGRAAILEMWTIAGPKLFGGLAGGIPPVEPSDAP